MPESVAFEIDENSLAYVQYLRLGCVNITKDCCIANGYTWMSKDVLREYIAITNNNDYTLAASKVKELIDEEGNAALKLRIYVTGGGCSGLQYGFTFDENVNEGDTMVEKNSVSLLIDPMSFQYLEGAEIDYSDGLEGSHFVIRHPSAQTTCGCGSSFSV